MPAMPSLRQQGALDQYDDFGQDSQATHVKRRAVSWKMIQVRTADAKFFTLLVKQQEEIWCHLSIQWIRVTNTRCRASPLQWDVFMVKGLHQCVQHHISPFLFCTR